MPEQPLPNAPPAMLRRHFQRLNVGYGLFRVRDPNGDGEARHAALLFGDPRSGVGALNQLAHVAARKTEGRLETLQLNRVELGEILGAVKSIDHR